MLKRMHLSNFKAWQQAEISFGRITGIFGTNSSGKSSLLQLLLLLKQTKNATDRGLVLDFGSSTDLVNLGTFTDAVHLHDKQKNMTWTLEWSLPDSLTIDEPMQVPRQGMLKSDIIETTCEIGLRQDRLSSHRLEYRFGGANFRLVHGGKNKYNLETQNTEFQFRRNIGRAWPLSSPIKTHVFPDDVRHFYQNTDFLWDFVLKYEALMDSIFYLGCARRSPGKEEAMS